MSDLTRLSPTDFRDLLDERGMRRLFFVWNEEEGRLQTSDPFFEPLARTLEGQTRDFDHHEGVFLQVGPRTGALQGAFVHRTCRGQGAGGVRRWTYDTLGDVLLDGLRLARGMTHKNALAGLWWGGGKGVIAVGSQREPMDATARRDLYRDYGDLVTSVRGCYVTAEDVGTCVADMQEVFARTRFTTCIPESLGGSGNPSVPTARGVVRGMEAALFHRGLGTLEGKTVALQGLGHVGEPLIRFLAEKGVRRIVASDIDPSRETLAREAAGPGVELEVRIVPRGDTSILGEPADILAPCATGGILGAETIPHLRAAIVCGAANNQLEDPLRDDRRLAERGILYLPDFLVNRMGIVTCADEAAGFVDHDPLIERHLDDSWDNGIFRLSLRVLEEAEKSNRTPAAVALAWAEERSLEPHPLFGHRGRRIIASLVESGWTEG